ncbi:hypothetical protein K3G63_03300 [Hymenobacter sp. HSC-4F20]|uniref:hypothetical protein n=1 Tax=Hymenobacter sp. HSC-4F20 TaxID=2864135 RepID=UPI001C72FCEF|nr:hypothetical protein [Hymenobacter sp. HSC-4F20]MBX0289445.1 hypothetical protein [Hymenobacter sp. HSC-4F20]
MNRLLPLLLLSLTLLTAACQKEEATPVEAPLEGRWTPLSTTEYAYSATGALTQKTNVPVLPDVYLHITRDSLSYRSTLNNFSLGSFKLVRQGKTLSYGTGAYCTILELTDHKLVLHYKAQNVAPGSPYTEPEDVYTR